MFERTPKSYIENILNDEFNAIKEREVCVLGEERLLRTAKLRNLNAVGNMTRKTRTRRPRIQSLQSGYCDICNAPYNSIDDHIQSKRHQKLIGDDAQYISLNGFLNHGGIEPFLNLDSMEVNGVLDSKRPRTRSASLCSRTKCSPLSPTSSEIGNHHLRSRRNINYMTPPLEDDSLDEKIDERGPTPELRELRSSARQLTKMNDVSNTEELWNSGRPKRSCIRQKRISADERLVSDNKSYYKVEVLNNKLRSEKELEEKRQPSPSKDEEKDKALIVKFKKMRNSELIQLNTEATNFLFPKKDETSDDDIDADGANTTISTERNDSTLLISDSEDCKPQVKFNVEDETSMDSSCSEKKKKRRTHAEAFIRDNQKYYKFETPGSRFRLRYQGSYLSPVLNKHKNNGDSANGDVGKEEKPFKLCLDNYSFSFERVPKNETWYEVFQRQDKGEIEFFNTYFWDEFVLPYQMPPLPPLDPKICIRQYQQLRKLLFDPPSTSSSAAGGSTPVPCTSDEVDAQDEDSKASAGSTSSEEAKRKRRRPPITTPSAPKNPRKSPRQHASTLAILSSLIQQRKRRSKTESPKVLPSIPEEKSPVKKNTTVTKKGSIASLYRAAAKIEEDLNNTLDEDDDLNLDELDISVDEGIRIQGSTVNVADILRMCDESKENELKRVKKVGVGGQKKKGCRRKKKNKTGWPSKTKKGRKEAGATKEDADDGGSTVDSVSLTCGSDEEQEDKEEKDEVTVKEESEVSCAAKRTSRRRRRMPGSPKSPRMLRKPRGRWYRER